MMIRDQIAAAIVVLTFASAGAFAMSGSLDGAATEVAEPPLDFWKWSAEAPQSEFFVELSRTDNGWLAAIDGDAAPAELRGDHVFVTGPDGQNLTLSPTEPNGFGGYWVQPPSPEGYQTVSTPVELSQTGDRRWEGHVQAQDRPFRMYLDVFREEDGEVTAILRNPERHDIRAAGFAVEPRAGGRYALVAGGGRIELDLQIADESLRLSHPRFEEPITLTAVSAAETSAYLPRPAASAPAERTAPEDRNDGWRIATPEEAGMDPAPLDDLVRMIARSDPRELRPRLVHSVLVSYQGALVFEEYFYGHDGDMRHDTRSLSKVFAPMLVGALQYSGVDIGGGATPIPHVFEQAGLPLDDPRKAEIKLADLMSFSSGLDCSEDNDSMGSEDRLWSETENFWLHTASLPVLHAPGERYAYCSASINLAGAAIEAAGGAPLHELFRQLIAEPLQFGPYHLAMTPRGRMYLGGGAYLRPRDVLKLGALHAGGGVWNGRRILSERWIEEATTPHLAITPQTTGMTEEEFANNYFGGEAGYEWRIDDVSALGRTYRTYEASGNGGQLIIVVPELELAVALTGGNYRQGAVWGRWRDEIVGGYVIPSIMRAE